MMNVSFTAISVHLCRMLVMVHSFTLLTFRFLAKVPCLGMERQVFPEGQQDPR